MRRFYAHYLRWEDYQHGMFRAAVLRDDDPCIAASVALLSDPDGLLTAMRRVVAEWPVSSSVNLTNQGLNRQAWLGQAACCLIHGAPEHITKAGWRTLAEETQAIANGIADRVIAEFELTQEPEPLRDDLFCGV